MFLFFGGIIFALFGVLGCADLVQKKKKCTEETTAIVTEISKEIDNDNNLSYWPIIEYNINGKKFKMYKLRSMVSNAEELKEKLLEQNEMSGPMFKMKDDPRITKVGIFKFILVVNNSNNWWSAYDTPIF